jgi:hypothetical protein
MNAAILVFVLFSFLASLAMSSSLPKVALSKAARWSLLLFCVYIISLFRTNHPDITFVLTLLKISQVVIFVFFTAHVIKYLLEKNVDDFYFFAITIFSLFHLLNLVL